MALDCLNIVIILLQNPDSADRLVSLISDMVKFNSSAYLSQAVVIRFIVRLAQIICRTNSDKDILQCLGILKCVVMYSLFTVHSLWVAEGIPYLKYSPMTDLSVFCGALRASHHLVL